MRFTWTLLPQLLGNRTTLLGTEAAVDQFRGWNGVLWGSGPTDDMVLDFDDEDGSSCYWRSQDRRLAQRDLLFLGEFQASKILYSYVEGRLCSIGFSLPTAWDVNGVDLYLQAAYGEPTSKDDETQTFAWNGRENAVRLRRKPSGGGSVAWFNIPLTRAVRKSA